MDLENKQGFILSLPDKVDLRPNQSEKTKIDHLILHKGIVYNII